MVKLSGVCANPKKSGMVTFTPEDIVIILVEVQIPPDIFVPVTQVDGDIFMTSGIGGSDTPRPRG